MATSKTKARGRAGKKSGPNLEQVLKRVQREAEALITRNRGEVQKRVQALRKELKTRADHALRDVERRIRKQLHAATEERVRKLERRVAKLEAEVRARSAPAEPAGRAA